MTEPEPIDAEGVREQNWPLLTRDSALTDTAGEMLYEVMRYLNHATRTPEATPWPATLSRLTGNLHATTAGLHQLCQQLADRAGQMSTDPAVLHSDRRQDRADIAHEMAATELMAAASALSDAAALANQLSDRLTTAHGHMTWLAYDD